MSETVDLTKKGHALKIDANTSAVVIARPLDRRKRALRGYNRPPRTVTIQVVQRSFVFETDTWTSTFECTWSDRFLIQMLPTLVRLMMAMQRDET